MTRSIGVIGGMGPAATLDFFGRLLALTPATRDAEHLRILIDCNPHVPERNAAVAGDGPSPGPALAAMARGLVAQGAELLAMPCNAAHAFAGAVTDAVDVPFVSILDTAAQAVGHRRTGLLAVDATLAAGLYQSRLSDPLLLPADAQRQFMALVSQVKAGDTGPEVRSAMAALAETLVAAGADVVLAACTEVPLVLPPHACPVPLLDTTGLLAAEVVALAIGSKTE
jgi:aspartate racemase